MRTAPIHHSSIVPPTIRPEILLAIAITTAVTDNPNYIKENPGIIAVARALHIDERALGETVAVKLHEVMHTMDGNTSVRVTQAEKYIANTARFLSPAGRAWGIIINSALANAKSDALKPEQTAIFGSINIKPLITTAGIVALLNSMGTTDVTLDGTNRTLAMMALEHIVSFGGPDNNVVAALLAPASKGKLKEVELIQVVRALRTEAANPQKEVSAEVIQIADETMSSLGYGDSRTDRTLIAPAVS